VGVWDTVSSVGWIEKPLHLPFTADNPSIVHGRHAVAIDERRAFFRSNLWRNNPQMNAHGPQDLKQVWFPGAHCDVGGGYPESESGLSKVPLKWMMEEAAALGLAIDGRRAARVLGDGDGLFVKPNPGAQIHDSLEWYWWPAEIVPKKQFDWRRQAWERRPNLGRQRTIPPGSLVHSAVLAQPPGYMERLPKDHRIVP
jgi:uncharacterized protein (DUF2235 family)